jgi:hypothetical protein
MKYASEMLESFQDSSSQIAEKVSVSMEAISIRPCKKVQNVNIFCFLLTQKALKTLKYLRLDHESIT